MTGSQETPAVSGFEPDVKGMHVLFMDISLDGKVLVGATSLLTREWYGALSCFKDCDAAVDGQTCLATTRHERGSGAVCGQFIEASSVIIGDDSGKLTRYQIDMIDGAHSFVYLTGVTSHDDVVTTMSTLNREKLVTGGADLRINVTNLAVFVTERSFPQAHSRLVKSVVKSPLLGESVFASTSLDRTALLWDLREKRPASAITKDGNFGLTTADWKTMHEIAFGDEAGHVSLWDIRSLRPVSDIAVEKQPIHKITFNDKGLLAVCGDSNRVTVWDCDSKKLFYESAEHSEFVRALFWWPKSANSELFSSGFDGKILSHKV